MDFVRPERPANRLPSGRIADGKGLAVVGIGASAGGLDACIGLIGVLPGAKEMAFILVQHLDPTHESMMVELLAGHTAMTVLQAEDGMPLAPDHLYVIPPGRYLSVAYGQLHVSKPQARHGTRLPFDFLLRSLAASYGARAACVILSGMGGDGSAGLVAVAEAGGLVVAQDPAEAAYGGMPQSAIATGRVDLVLPVASIVAALIAHAEGRPVEAVARRSAAGEPPSLSAIIDLLRSGTLHDFGLYKQGTLRRRIERRMVLVGIGADDMGRYLQLLRGDAAELELLAKDLLIHVTSFFRDPKVFQYLADTIIPDLVRGHAADRPLRLWVAGCSTGEETYSLAMLLQEEIARSGRTIKLQIFASDVDADAVATAREGIYPETISDQVAPARLARFFVPEDPGWRIAPELRALVVFTVQDVLADPPFARLDLVSCRNLLIYLQPDAQERALEMFHFALREGGFLLLGTAETAGVQAGRFELLAKAERLYRRIGRSRSEALNITVAGSDGLRLRSAGGAGRAPSRQTALAELGRRLVLDAYAPAAVLINRANDCMFALGPTDRFLRLPSGHPSQDLLAMVRPGLRSKLRAAIELARQDSAKVAVNCRVTLDRVPVSVKIEVSPVLESGESLLLVCFVETAGQETSPDRPPAPGSLPRLAELERELVATRTDLQGAIRDLELSTEEQKAINEEALSVNEEYQSTNEELLASKEELQSLNEELTALNGQLHEALERQRTTADDMRNVLYSTHVATLFLDLGLRIRFFTPTTKSLFAVLPSDIGRPLADLASLASDASLAADIASVLHSMDATEAEAEIETTDGNWFRRRVLPYLGQGDRVEGVVITYNNVTARKQAAAALEKAKAAAELATIAKSRFLAAASHDLRQPLQALSLLQGLLARSVVDPKPLGLIKRLDVTLASMTAMLDTLLDINQIEAGVIRPKLVDFGIGEVLARLRDEFTYVAEAKHLSLRVVSSRATVRSDPGLLEQMIRNLLSNALKYTAHGKVLLGCRHRGGTLHVQMLDTGIGIPQSELRAIFDEYHQIGNAARERSRGLGLGLSIVQRLGGLLEHPVHVSSLTGRGSVFSIEIPLAAGRHEAVPKPEAGARPASAEPASRTGLIMIVEDDPVLRELLELLLRGEGHQVMTAPDGPAALAILADSAPPNLLLTDFNLPNGISGLQLTKLVRLASSPLLPVIVLTGDKSVAALPGADGENCVLLGKPVNHADLMGAVGHLLPRHPAAEPAHVPRRSGGEGSAVFVVDDDRHVRESIRAVLDDDGWTGQDFATGEAFLRAYHPVAGSCLLVDAYLPGMTGLDVLRRLRSDGHAMTSIMITGQSDVATAVLAMKAGASDFIEKPIGRDELLASIDRALEQSRDGRKLTVWRENAATQVATLTPRQQQIMAMVAAGHPSKNIAADLRISQRTVENHRASIMRKTGCASVPALARLAFAASWSDAEAV